MSRYIYDSAALIAAERSSTHMKVVHHHALKERQLPLVPGPVVTQVWRGGPRSARLAHLLKQCEVLCGFPAEEFYAAGVLAPRVKLPATKRFDVIDMLVAISARLHGASAIITSDDADIHAYLDALNYECKVIHV